MRPLPPPQSYRACCSGEAMAICLLPAAIGGFDTAIQFIADQYLCRSARGVQIELMCRIFLLRRFPTIAKHGDTRAVDVNNSRSTFVRQPFGPSGFSFADNHVTAQKAHVRQKMRIETLMVSIWLVSLSGHELWFSSRSVFCISRSKTRYSENILIGAPSPNRDASSAITNTVADGDHGYYAV